MSVTIKIIPRIQQKKTEKILSLWKKFVITTKYFCRFDRIFFFSTLEYEISVQVAINVQVGYFLQKNKRKGLSKHTGGNLDYINTHICNNKGDTTVTLAKKVKISTFELG